MLLIRIMKKVAFYCSFKKQYLFSYPSKSLRTRGINVQQNLFFKEDTLFD